MKEKFYNLRISEKELADAKVKNALVRLLKNRIKFQKNKKYHTVSMIELMILKRSVYGWADVSLYAPNKKDRFPGEIGKFMGKRVCVRGKR